MPNNPQNICYSGYSPLAGVHFLAIIKFFNSVAKSQLSYKSIYMQVKQRDDYFFDAGEVASKSLICSL